MASKDQKVGIVLVALVALLLLTARPQMLGYSELNTHWGLLGQDARCRIASDIVGWDERGSPMYYCPATFTEINLAVLEAAMGGSTPYRVYQASTDSYIDLTYATYTTETKAFLMGSAVVDGEVAATPTPAPVAASLFDNGLVTGITANVAAALIVMGGGFLFYKLTKRR